MEMGTYKRRGTVGGGRGEARGPEDSLPLPPPRRRSESPPRGNGSSRAPHRQGTPADLRVGGAEGAKGESGEAEGGGTSPRIFAMESEAGTLLLLPGPSPALPPRAIVA